MIIILGKKIHKKAEKIIFKKNFADSQRFQKL